MFEFVNIIDKKNSFNAEFLVGDRVFLNFLLDGLAVPVLKRDGDILDENGVIRRRSHLAVDGFVNLALRFPENNELDDKADLHGKRKVNLETKAGGVVEFVCDTENNNPVVRAGVDVDAAGWLALLLLLLLFFFVRLLQLRYLLFRFVAVVAVVVVDSVWKPLY